MVCWMIDRFGSAEVKEKYLSSMITMENMGSYCLTEPSSGSDAAALKTKAVLDGDHYVVSGSKAFISGGGANDVMIAMVRTGEEGPKGISALVIEKDMKGVSFGAQERKLGWHSQPTSQVNFDEVRVPVANRVGGEGDGFRIAMMGVDGGRLNIGACSLGGGQRCLDEAIAYTRDRKQFGQAIADFQATQFTLADMETELQAARHLLYVAAAKVTANSPDKTKFAAMAKRLATDTGLRRRSCAGSSTAVTAISWTSNRALLARPSGPLHPRGHQPDHARDRQSRPAPPVTDDVLISVERGVGRLRLNRPKAIHALTTQMCEAMSQDLFVAYRPRRRSRAHRPCGGPRILRRRRCRHARPQREYGNAEEAKRFFWPISPQPPALHVSQDDRRYHGRHHDGRRLEILAPVHPSRRDREHALRHA